MRRFRLGHVRAIPTVLFLAAIVPASLAAQTKPTEAQILKAIRTNLGGEVTSGSGVVGSVASASGAGIGRIEVTVESVKVLRFGLYNSQY